MKLNLTIESDLIYLSEWFYNKNKKRVFSHPQNQFFTCQTCESATRLAAFAADAFGTAFVAVDVRDRESNECPCGVMSLERLFVMSFQLVDF
jgi:hypothetical protein